MLRQSTSYYSEPKKVSYGSGALVPSFVEEAKSGFPSQKSLSSSRSIQEYYPPQFPFILQASRLGVIKGAVLEAGLTSFPADVSSRYHRSSTIKQYQVVWSKF